ncbi:MAG: hypothetical protein FJ225_00055 [Lentisphaerae bacterium]|nr:hypothetical protein [Lentisphaerota bacterium]
MNDPHAKEGMSLIVKTVTRWLKGFLLLYGAYIVLYGHLTPGGGFAGGVIVACAFILVFLACGAGIGHRTLGRLAASELDSAGALIFTAVGALGIALGGVFFRNFIRTPPEAHFRLLSSGVIPVCNIAIGLKVGTSLFMVLAILSAVHVAVKGGRRRMVRRREDKS